MDKLKALLRSVAPEREKGLLKDTLAQMGRGGDRVVKKLFPGRTFEVGQASQPVPAIAQTQDRMQALQRQIEPTPEPTPSETGTARNPNVSKFKIADNVSNAIDLAAREYGMPASLLYDIALQESSFDPSLTNPDPNSTASGLFQFTKGTWDTLANYANTEGSSLKRFNPDYQARFDPELNALAAAYLISNGQLGRWDASRDVWGPYYSLDEVTPYYAQTQDDSWKDWPSWAK